MSSIAFGFDFGFGGPGIDGFGDGGLFHAGSAGVVVVADFCGGFAADDEGGCEEGENESGESAFHGRILRPRAGRGPGRPVDSHNVLNGTSEQDVWSRLVEQRRCQSGVGRELWSGGRSELRFCGEIRCFGCGRMRVNMTGSRETLPCCGRLTLYHAMDESTRFGNCDWSSGDGLRSGGACGIRIDTRSCGDNRVSIPRDEAGGEWRETHGGDDGSGTASGAGVGSGSDAIQRGAGEGWEVDHLRCGRTRGDCDAVVGERGDGDIDGTGGGDLVVGAAVAGTVVGCGARGLGISLRIV
jgi:hypothetical protein